MVSKKLADLLKANGVPAEKINKVILKERNYLSNLGFPNVMTKYAFDSYVRDTAVKAGYNPNALYNSITALTATMAAGGALMTLVDGSALTTGIMVAGMVGFIYNSRLNRLSNTLVKSAKYLINKGVIDRVLDQYINGLSGSGYSP